MSRTAYGGRPKPQADFRRRGGDIDSVRRVHKVRVAATDLGGGAVSEGTTAVRQALGVEDVLATDEARGLLEVGKQAGSLSAEEIALALDELDLEPGALDSFYDALEAMEISVVEEPQQEEEVVPAELAREISTDSLQLFLKDIGKVDLLTAAQEVELAKRIERGDHRPGARRREVRLPQGLQVLDVRDVVDSAGGRAGARRQGADDPHARPRRREAEQDRALGAQASRRARSRAVVVRDRPRARSAAGRGRADPPQRADAGVAREARRRRGGVGVWSLPDRRVRACARRGGGDGDAQGGAEEGALDALAA